MQSPQPEKTPPLPEEVANKSIILETRPLENIAPPPESSPVQIARPAIVTVWDALQARKHVYTETSNPRIQRQLDHYLSEANYISRLMQRAEPFLFHILKTLEQEDLPAELALLPAVESAYLSNARSRHGARGLWQIMPATARELGLKIDWWYDGRRDVIASTQAALVYLRLLNTRLDGDWLLTLAAYNAGYTTINQAIQVNTRKGLPTDFWHLQLPQETMNYVPRFLAIVDMVDNPDTYNITLPDIPWKPGFSRIILNKPVDLQQLARHSKTNIIDLQKLNPAYKRGVTPRKGKYELLALPNVTTALHASIKQLPPAKLAKGQSHRVVRGETLSHISRHYRVSVAALRQVNQLQNNRIRAGKNLIIPGNASFRTQSSQSRTDMYIVRQGDTLWSIAKRYSTTVQKLASLNALSIHEILQPGKELILHPG